MCSSRKVFHTYLKFPSTDYYSKKKYDKVFIMENDMHLCLLHLLEAGHICVQTHTDTHIYKWRYTNLLWNIKPFGYGCKGENFYISEKFILV